MKRIWQLVFIALGSASTLLVCVSLACTVTRAQAAPQNQADASAEQSAYQAAHNEKDQQAKIKLLDDFVSAYPDSPLLPQAYRDRYEAYFLMGEYRQAIDYADKFAALGDKVDVNMRVLAIITREVAYSADCSHPELRVQNAYTKARDAGRQGLALLAQWHKPENLSQEQFDAEKKSFAIILSQVTQMAEAGLAGRNISCPANPPDPGNFEQMIRDIQEQEEQSPNVR